MKSETDKQVNLKPESIHNVKSCSKCQKLKLSDRKSLNTPTSQDKTIILVNSYMQTAPESDSDLSDVLSAHEKSRKTENLNG